MKLNRFSGYTDNELEKGKDANSKMCALHKLGSKTYNHIEESLKRINQSLESLHPFSFLVWMV